jgi:hypothetical protein
MTLKNSYPSYRTECASLLGKRCEIESLNERRHGLLRAAKYWRGVRLSFQPVNKNGQCNH